MSGKVQALAECDCKAKELKWWVHHRTCTVYVVNNPGRATRRQQPEPVNG